MNQIEWVVIFFMVNIIFNNISHSHQCSYYSEACLQLTSLGPTLMFGTFTNKTDRHDITEILLKVTLKTIILTLVFRIHIPVHIYLVYTDCINKSFLHWDYNLNTITPIHPPHLKFRLYRIWV